MSRQTIDPIALHLALRRIARRESGRAAARRSRARPGFWRLVFTPRRRREHRARLGPAEIVHNNLAT
jgi:hypothetical protein